MKDNYKVVPIEPTKEMMKAFCSVNFPASSFTEAYKAMLEATPSMQGKPLVWINCYEGGMYDTVYKCPKCGKKYSLQAEDIITKYTCKCGFHGSLYDDSSTTAVDCQEYKRAVWESLEIVIQHAKVANNPFEFLCNQITAMHNTEFSVRNNSSTNTTNDASREEVLKMLNKMLFWLPEKRYRGGVENGYWEDNGAAVLKDRAELLALIKKLSET